MSSRNMSETKHPYRMTEEGLFWTKNDGQSVRLTNFPAWIAAQIVEDNGTDTNRLYEMEAVLDGVTHRFTIPATEYSSLRWVDRELGAKAITASGPALREKIREAIQLFSQDGIGERRVFTHTGWRKVQKDWVYCYHGGAIGGVEVETRLPNGLERYCLPPLPNDPDKVKEAVSASLALLNIAPHPMTLPLLAAVYTAPLGEIIPNDYAFWIWGPTGSRKSTVAALALSHYGYFTRSTLPANFTSTGNALEIQASTLKDVLMVVDDYSPASKDDAVLRLIRALGDNHGRSRATSTGGLQKTRFPRALVMVTAEMEPPGSQSSFARTFTVHWDRDSVDLKALTAAQSKHAPLYPLAMAAYLEWLSTRIDCLKATLPQKMESLRRRFVEHAMHGRIAESAAKLLIGWDVFLQFVVECKAIDKEKAGQLRREAVQSLIKLSEETNSLTEEEKPVKIALRLLASVFESKSAYLTSHSGQIPDEAERYGWVMTISEWDNKESSSYNLKAGSTLIGWISEDGIIYLDPETTFEKICRTSSSQGKPFPLRTTRSLGEALKEAGLLAQADTDRATVRVSKDGKIHRYWAIREDNIWPDKEETLILTVEDPFAADEKDNSVTAKVPTACLAQLHGL